MPPDETFRVRIKRRDQAFITVQAASSGEAEDKVWDLIENDYDAINDLPWDEGEHIVDRVSLP